MLTYSQRRNVFEKGRWEWAAAEDSISVTDHRGGQRARKWSDVEALRLGASPTEQKPWRYVMVLRFKGGDVWKLDNSSFAGLGDFTDQSQEFAAFARAAAVKIAARAPSASMRVGEGPVFYWLLLAALFLVIVFLGAMLAVAEPIPGPGWVKAGFMLIFLPALIGWARKAYPRRAPIGDIPDSAFPPAP